MHHLLPRFALVAGLASAIVVGCDGGSGSLVSIPSPFSDVPNDGRSAYPDDGRSSYNPGVSDPTEGAGGSTTNPQGGGGKAGSSSGGGNICDKCSDLAKCGFPEDQCNAGCAKVSASCESCINGLQSCDDLTNCTSVCNASSGQGGTDNGQGGTDNGQGGTVSTGDGICGSCDALTECGAQDCESTCASVTGACAACINDAAASGCSALQGCADACGG